MIEGLTLGSGRNVPVENAFFCSFQLNLASFCSKDQRVDRRCVATVRNGYRLDRCLGFFMERFDDQLCRACKLAGLREQRISVYAGFVSRSDAWSPRFDQRKQGFFGESVFEMTHYATYFPRCLRSRDSTRRRPFPFFFFFTTMFCRRYLLSGLYPVDAFTNFLHGPLDWDL